MKRESQKYRSQVFLGCVGGIAAFVGIELRVLEIKGSNKT